MKYLYTIFAIFYGVTCYASTKTAPTIYCPPQIKCTKKGDPSSCKYEKINNFVEFGEPYSEAPVVSGVYTLSEVSSSFLQMVPLGRHSLIASAFACRYKNIDSHLPIERSLFLPPIIPASFEASLETGALWNVVDLEAKCITEDALKCPIRQLPEISLASLSLKDTSADVRLIKDGVEYRQRISYETLLEICGATSMCKIDIKDVRYNEVEQKGFVLLDISTPDNVKIVYIDDADLTSIKLSQDTNFNIIYWRNNKDIKN